MDTLKRIIENSEVTDATIVYDLLLSKSVEIPAEIKQSLLELLCFYNQKDPTPVDMFEERDNIRVQSRNKDAEIPTWHNAGFAEKLFESFGSKTPDAYSAIICGMFKYNQLTKGRALFDEAIEKQVPLDIEVYNYAMKAGMEPKIPLEMRWNTAMDFLSKINERQLKPNVNTLNCVLYALNGNGPFELLRRYTLQTLAEFKNVGVEPSLGSWYLVLKIFCRDNAPTSGILIDILNQVENKEFKAQTLIDTHFFVNAMVVCYSHLNDEQLARRVDAFLNFGNNYLLIGDSIQERQYYRHFLTITCRNEPFSQFIELYEQLVPNVYSLDNSVLEELFNKINLCGAIHYIPRIGSDMIVCRSSLQSQEQLLTLMVDNQPQAEIEDHSGLNEKFADIACNFFNRFEQIIEEQSPQGYYNGRALSYTIILCSRAIRYENAVAVMRKFLDGASKIHGDLLPEAVEPFIELCIKLKRPSDAVRVLEYSIEKNIGDPIKYAKMLVQSLTLDERYLNKITHLVGPKVLQSIHSEENKEKVK